MLEGGTACAGQERPQSQTGLRRSSLASAGPFRPGRAQRSPVLQYPAWAGRRNSSVVKSLPTLLEAIKDDDESGEWVGPPQAQEGVEDETEQNRAGQISVNQCDSP